MSITLAVHSSTLIASFWSSRRALHRCVEQPGRRWSAQFREGAPARVITGKGGFSGCRPIQSGDRFALPCASYRRAQTGCGGRRRNGSPPSHGCHAIRCSDRHPASRHGKRPGAHDRAQERHRRVLSCDPRRSHESDRPGCSQREPLCDLRRLGPPFMRRDATQLPPFH